jgi:signal transduction histidine kinase
VTTLLASIGQQVSLAIENAHLYNQAERSAAVAERTRLARELHDSVTQSLYSVTLYAQAVAARMAAGDYSTATQHVKELGDTAQEALREMRLLIFELRPMELEKNGLAAALQSRLDSVEARGGMKSELHVSGNLELPIPIQRELYHIAREALNNIFKHAYAHFVSIELAAEDEQVRMEICDDGIGFDLDRIQPGGLGLPGIQERVEKIGGELNIVSTPGSGTRIQVVVGLTAQQKYPTPDYQGMEY